MTKQYQTHPLSFLSYLDEFSEALQERLEEKSEKYQDTWLTYPRIGQSQRIFQALFRYFWNWLLYREPVPWLDVAGNAFFAWLRNTHPEMAPNWIAEDDWDDSVPVTLIPLETGKLYQAGGRTDPQKAMASYDPPIAQIKRGEFHEIMAKRKAQELKLGEMGLKATGTVGDADES